MEKTPLSKKPKKKPSEFNRLPINPPKDYKHKEVLPSHNFRTIPR